MKTTHATVMAMVVALLAGLALPGPGAWANAKDELKAADQAGQKQAQADRLAALAAARKIDELVAAGYAANKVSPTGRTTDEQFLRRVHLDVTGTIPNLEQTRAFLESRDQNKRAKLIDELLASPGYVSHFYNVWADALRIQSRIRGDEAGNWGQWVKDALASNMPYDQFVFEMLTAQGSTFDDGASGFFMRDQGMILDTLANTSQVFLGTKIGCAQCHDHPFDSWTQKDFYQLATFLEQVQTRANRDPKLREVQRLVKSKDIDNKTRQVLQRLVRGMTYGVRDDSRKTLRLPSDYKYKNAKPGSTVPAQVIFGSLPQAKDDLSQRQLFAQWLTGKDNPRFAKVIANRLWKQVMGMGIVEPIDEFYSDTKGCNPELLAYLGRIMVDFDFDMKQYLRALLNSKTYQLAVGPKDMTRETYHAQGSVLRRMRAEQVWDSLVTLAAPEPDERQGVVRAMGDRYSEVTKMAREAKTAQELLDLAKKLADNPRAVLGGGGQARSRGRGPQLVRASEMPSPAPPGTFLEDFGQADRETVDSASVDPTVPQALAMMNGRLVDGLINRQSVLMKNVAQAKTPEDKIATIYLSILNRKPYSGEERIALDEVKASGDDAYGNLAWALLNSREFIFIK